MLTLAPRQRLRGRPMVCNLPIRPVKVVRPLIASAVLLIADMETVLAAAYFESLANEDAR